MPTRLAHFEFFVTKDFGVGDARQVPASGVTVEVRRLGAVANGSGSFADGVGGTITVRDPGRLRSGDTIVIAAVGGIPGSISRTLSAATETSITVSAGAGAFAWSGGSFFTATNNKPNIYADPVGGGTAITASQLTTDSRGFAHCWADEESVDRVESGGGVTTRFVPNLGGTGGSERSSASVTTASGQPAHLLDTKEAIAATQPALRVANNGTEEFDIHGDGSWQSKGGGTIDAGGLLVTAGGATITAGGLTVVAGAVDFPANSIPGGDVQTSTITATQLANDAAVNLVTDDQAALFAIPATYDDTLGVSVTITPDSTSSIIYLHAVVPVTGLAAADASVIARIIDDQGSPVVYAEAGCRTDTTSARQTISLIGTATGFSSARTFKVQVREEVGSAQVDGDTDRKARIVAIEFKKQA